MSEDVVQQTSPDPTATATPRRWWVLLPVVLAQLMVVLDGTVVNIALPSAQSDLGFSNGDRQWIITAYALAFGSLLLLGGRLADMLGRKRVFLIGLAGFAAASAVGGAAGNFDVLVAARAVQGAAGALLAPAALAVLITTFTAARERALAFGVFSAAATSGAGVGLILGGVLTQDLSWRWTMYINVFIGAIAAVGGIVFIEHTRRHGPRPALDIAGTALASAGLFALVFGFSEAESDGWGSPMCWAMLAASGVLLVAFVAWQRRATDPLLPLGVVVDRNRGAAFSAVLLAGVGMFGVFLFVTYYLQDTLGYSPIKSGLAFLPMVAMLTAAAQLASNVLLPRFGPKVVVPFGMALSAIGLVYLTRLGVHSGYAADILPALLLVGFGVGNIITSSFQTATLGVAPQFAGVAAATVNTSQQIGGAIGVALLNTLAAAATAGYLTAHRHSLGVAARATVHGYSVADWWGAGIYAFGAVLTVLLFRRRPRRATPPQPVTAETAAEDVLGP
jgi:EmrB/QacA subfamily drug resistance transporter